MNKKDAEILFKKYLAGECDPEEQLLFESLYAGIAGSEKQDGLDKYDLNTVKEKIYTRLPQPVPAKKIKLWPQIIAVSAAIAAVVFGVWLYTSPLTVNPNSKIVHQHDIAPGANKATLTLGNGKILNLSNAKTGVVIGNDLSYNDGSAVERRNAGQQGKDMGEILIATTPRGGTYQVILSDHSRVWLNAASSLKFPSTFKSGSERKVELTGEAYFEIFKNKKQPFVVKSGNQEITVLGTHFNVNSYADEASVKTTLLEGSVRIVSLHPSKSAEGEVVLKPNQQAILTGNKLKVSEANTEAALAWKNGYFVFINEDIRSIMRKISRWYNIDVVYEGQIENKAIWGSVSRFSNVSEVLNMLSATKTVKFKMEGKKIIVLPERQ